MLARAEGGCHGAGGVRTRACGKVPSGATQCEERKGSRPPEPPPLTTTVTAARAALSPSGFPWNSQQGAKNAGQRSSGAGLAPAKPRRGSSRYGLSTRVRARGAGQRVGRSGNLSHRLGGLGSCP